MIKEIVKTREDEEQFIKAYVLVCVDRNLETMAKIPRSKLAEIYNTTDLLYFIDRAFFTLHQEGAIAQLLEVRGYLLNDYKIDINKFSKNSYFSKL